MVIQKVRPDTTAATVAVIIPTLNEGKYLKDCLVSLENQSLSSGYEIILADSQSSDETRAIGKQYGARILDCPAGKLTARDLAIRAIHHNIVVACDADTFYPRPFLERITEHLLKKTPGIVGVTGPRLYGREYDKEIFSGVLNGVNMTIGDKTHRFYGSNSAFTRQGYFMAGGFNLDINQQDSRAMVEEEEVLFMRRLQAFGIIMYQGDNPVYTSTRRFSRKDADFQHAVKTGQRF